METSRRPFLPAIASLMLLHIPLILGGCNPPSQDVAEDTPALGSSPTTVVAEPGNDQVGTREVFFDFDHISNGLSMDSGGDVDTEVVTVGDAQEQAFRTGNGRVLPSQDGNTEQDWYMQFRVDDGFLYAGSPTSQVRIEIEYLDEGTDEFSIQYDAVSGGPSGDGRFKDSDVVAKTDTGEFKVAVFALSDAYFANRNNGADFRITRSRGQLIENSWAALLMATYHPSAILRAPDEEDRARMHKEFVEDLQRAVQALSTEPRARRTVS